MAKGGVESSQNRERSDARKPQLLERRTCPADLGQNPAEPSLLCFNHIYWIGASLQRRKDRPLTIKITCDHVLAIMRARPQGPLCVMPLLICDTSYSESFQIMSNQVMLVQLWLSAVLHDQRSYQHRSPPPAPSVNTSPICSCWKLPTITWLPWEHLDPYIPALRACIKYTWRGWCGCFCQLFFRKWSSDFFSPARQLSLHSTCGPTEG